MLTLENTNYKPSQTIDAALTDLVDILDMVYLAP